MSANRMFNVLVVFALLLTAAVAIGAATAAQPLQVEQRATAGDLAIYHQSEWGSIASRQPSFSAAGWAMYLASERGLAANAVPGTAVDGLAVYHQSEWGSIASRQPSFSGAALAIYLASERGLAANAVPGAAVDGLAVYHDSERGSVATLALRSTVTDLAIYHQSEWGRIATDGLNAYQRSEWLGADR